MARNEVEVVTVTPIVADHKGAGGKAEIDRGLAAASSAYQHSEHGEHYRDLRCLYSKGHVYQYNSNLYLFVYILQKIQNYKLALCLTKHCISVLFSRHFLFILLFTWTSYKCIRNEMIYDMGK